MVTERGSLISHGLLSRIADQCATDDDFLILRVAGLVRGVGGRALEVVEEDQSFRGRGGNRDGTDGVRRPRAVSPRAPLREGERAFEIRSPDSAGDCHARDGRPEREYRTGEGE